MAHEPVTLQCRLDYIRRLLCLTEDFPHADLVECLVRCAAPVPAAPRFQETVAGFLRELVAFAATMTQSITALTITDAITRSHPAYWPLLTAWLCPLVRCLVSLAASRSDVSQLRCFATLWCDTFPADHVCQRELRPLVLLVPSSCWWMSMSSSPSLFSLQDPQAILARQRLRRTVAALHDASHGAALPPAARSGSETTEQVEPQLGWSRNWNPTAATWTKGAQVDAWPPRVAAGFFAHKEAQDAAAAQHDAAAAAVKSWIAADAEHRACEVCGDELESAWDTEMDVFVFVGAVRDADGTQRHVGCSVAAGPLLPVAGPLLLLLPVAGPLPPVAGLLPPVAGLPADAPVTNPPQFSRRVKRRRRH